MKHRTIWVLTLIALFAAACSGAPAASTTVAPATTAAPTAAEPTLPPTQPATEAAATTEAPASTTEAAAPTATEAVTQAADTAAPAGQTSATPAGSALSGAVVYTIVPGESTASYEVGETFLDQNRFATAIGVTPAVNGTVTVDPANPQAAQISEITVDISQLTSDSARRDNAIRERFLASSQFPIATFVPSGISGLPATYTEGQDITFQVTGDLTVAQATRPVTFDVTARIAGGALTGVATTTIKMSDFGVGPISMAVIRTEDDVKVTLNFVARA